MILDLKSSTNENTLNIYKTKCNNLNILFFAQFFKSKVMLNHINDFTTMSSTRYKR